MDLFHSMKPHNSYSLYIGKRLRGRCEQESGETSGKPSLLDLAKLAQMRTGPTTAQEAARGISWNKIN